MTQVKQSTVIFGCGNSIMGDDGFGPAVIEELRAHKNLPPSVMAIDAGTIIREYLFDYLLTDDGRPENLIILDAVDCKGRKPGEVFELSVTAIPSLKISDFSLHQFPTVNLLAELCEFTGIRVDLLVVQIGRIPDEISVGLSQPVKKAIPVACDKVLQLLDRFL